jgi:2-oxoglutarate dehydrogenase E2 component (dihydrolipoamide succinyltransferase)
MAQAKTFELNVPTLGESVAEATVARWAKNAGDAVREDDVLVELETDKVTLEVTSPATGILKSIQHSKGAAVKVGDILGIVEEADVKSQATNTRPPTAIIQPTQATPAAPQEAQLSPATTQTAPLSPATAKWVADHNLNPTDIHGTGKDGRLTKGDVINHLQRTSEGSATRLEKRVPMSRLRQRVAQRLKQAQNTAAILTTFNEVDMSTVNALRAKYKDAFEKQHGIKLGFMSFFVKACVYALQQIPMMNSRIEGDEIITSNYHDIGVAISAPQGLVVPIVRDADLLSFADIEKHIVAYGQKAKEGKLTLDDMSGGTFTISNGGTFGSLLSTPIINPPQSGILGMHKIQERPVVENGQIVIRPMMYLALSYDHRLIDGRDAVTFLVMVKEFLENPGKFLLGL